MVTPAAVELSVSRGEGDCGQRILGSVWRKGTIFLVVMKMTASSASVAEDIKKLMISAMVRMGPFKRGMGSSSERKICAPSRLQVQDSLRYPASVWPARNISLAR